MSTSVDFNECIFGPLRQQAGRADRGCSGEPIRDQPTVGHGGHRESTLDATVFDESVLAPILAARMGAAAAKERGGKVGNERRDDKRGKPIEKEEGKLREKMEERRHRSDCRSLSTFEKMMASLEQSSCNESTKTDTSSRGHNEDLDQEKAKSSTGANISLPPLPAVSRDSTATSESASLPESDSVQTLPGEGIYSDLWYTLKHLAHYFCRLKEYAKQARLQVQVWQHLCSQRGELIPSLIL